MMEKLTFLYSEMRRKQPCDASIPPVGRPIVLWSFAFRRSLQSRNELREHRIQGAFAVSSQRRPSTRRRLVRLLLVLITSFEGPFQKSKKI